MTAPRPSPRPRDPRVPVPPAPAPRPTSAPVTGDTPSRRRFPMRPRRRQGTRWEPQLDPTSWTGAFLAMTIATAVIWTVQIVDAVDHYGLNRFGLRPREIDGLWGVLTQPFLHAGYRDMLSDTLPLILIGWVVMLAGLRTWLLVSLAITVVGGALTWAGGPGGTLVIGSSSLVFGWIGYLIARAVFSRQLKWILAAAMVLTIFGALLAELVPLSHSAQSWQAHLFGFLAGAGTGALLHPRHSRRRGRPQRSGGRSAVS